MTKTEFPDEILMRFADGELDADTSAKLEQAMETDDELVSRLSLFMETRAAAGAALKPLIDEPVPAELAAAVERMIADKKAAQDEPRGTVSRLPLRGVNDNDNGISRWFVPIAAALVAALGGYWLGAGGDPAAEGGGLRLARIDDPALTEALQAVPSGEERQIAGTEQRFRAIATFRDNADSLCREFELDSADRSTLVSIACHSGGEWRVTFAMAAASDDGGYAPASSAEALDVFLQAINAAPPMELAEEAQALEAIHE